MVVMLAGRIEVAIAASETDLSALVPVCGIR